MDGSSEIVRRTTTLALGAEPRDFDDARMRRKASVAANGDGGRILIVDDDQTTCEVLDLLLKREHRTVWRTSPRAALELVAEGDFDVILTDLNMAEFCGLDLCRRALELRPDVPVIVVTGDDSLEAAIAATHAGAYDFVNKPARAGLIEMTVRRALRHKRLQEEVKRLRQGAGSPSEPVVTSADNSPSRGFSPQ